MNHRVEELAGRLRASGISDAVFANLHLVSKSKNGKGMNHRYEPIPHKSDLSVPEDIHNFYPFNAIGKIYVEFDDGTKMSGHVTMITETVALTAAHLLLSPPDERGGRKKIQKCIFIFQKRAFEVDCYEVHPKWGNFSNREETVHYCQYDIAKLHFSQPLMRKEDIDFIVLKENPLNVNVQVITFNDADETFYGSFGKNIEHDQIGYEGMANYDAETQDGFSGAPVVTMILDDHGVEHYALLYTHTNGRTFAGRDCFFNGGVILKNLLDFLNEPDPK